MTPLEPAARESERSAPGPDGDGGGLPGPRRGLPTEAPGGVDLDNLLRAALDEDLGAGDLTSRMAVPAGARASARLVAKEAGVLAGLGCFARVFELCDAGIVFETSRQDGDTVAPGDQLARLEGDAHALLAGERTALNLLQRLCGIATRTASFVKLAEAAAGERQVRILDTRKTTPGLRVLEKYAVRCGGGENHRIGLFDEVMLKENHIDLAGRPIGEVLADLRTAVGDGVRITAEARDGREAQEAVRGGADVVLLDNMTPAQMAALAPELRSLGQARGRELELEASGGIGAGDLEAVAASGVDRISIGALTHSVSALDLSLYLEPVR
ncbi:MAG: nicotinate-nucleotide pyrophosphorylase (carboxylating) [Chlamydiales bacterium]|jgi:nicotinate-nucleotide pyrophosphorylase (carboxylating)